MELHLPKKIQTRTNEAILFHFQVHEEVFSGKMKKQLTDWYLDLIENHTEESLISIGYHPNAVPYNYLDEPPKVLFFR
jgi:hypothetical protein